MRESQHNIPRVNTRKSLGARAGCDVMSGSAKSSRQVSLPACCFGLVSLFKWNFITYCVTGFPTYYGLYFMSHLFASLTREILFLPLEHKIHIFSPPCNILYLRSVRIEPNQTYGLLRSNSLRSNEGKSFYP